ncbi:MAG: flagellar biosynthetic protein FliQ [Alphaproteobacteria bacterium]|jgi:flagellar biosynthetic protein FliQ
MNEVMVLEVGKDAVYTLLLVVSPLLFIAMFVGLLIGLFQTLTQLQEMTLVFVPKILLVFVSLIFLLPFMMERLRIFTEGLYDRIVALGY